MSDSLRWSEQSKKLLSSVTKTFNPAAMRHQNWLLPLLAAGVTAAPASTAKDSVSSVVKNGVKYTVFEHAATGAKMEFVKNSGICETTPGVNQYSGYLSVGNNMNMWFW
jgi:carboxypeptidase D